ncbi:MAG: hypothetical protein AAF661_05190 [Pseudomonadota bacterium]
MSKFITPKSKREIEALAEAAGGYAGLAKTTGVNASDISKYLRNDWRFPARWFPAFRDAAIEHDCAWSEDWFHWHVTPAGNDDGAVSEAAA